MRVVWGSSAWGLPVELPTHQKTTFRPVIWEVAVPREGRWPITPGNVFFLSTFVAVVLASENFLFLTLRSASVRAGSTPLHPRGIIRRRQVY